MEVDIDYILENGDPRAESFPLMQSPTLTILIVLSYLVFIKILGPYWMRNRRPFELRKTMVIYNIAVVILNTWLFSRFSMHGWLTTYSWRCEPTDYSNNEIAMEALFTCYVFYLSKLVELLDTIFFVFRKKYSQVTFLHAFHHSYVPITSWILVKYIGGGFATIFPFFNTFVHIWMYLYYGLSAMGPSIQKYLWWKRYLTILQLMQFVAVMVFSFQAVVFPVENCTITNLSMNLNLCSSIIFFALFMHFYFTSYINKSLKTRKNLGPLEKLK